MPAGEPPGDTTPESSPSANSERDPTPGSAQAAARAAPRARGRWRLRAEDWLLAVWVAVVVPALLTTQAPAAGLFDPGRPLDGLLGVVAVVGAAVCLAARHPDDRARTGSPASAAVGPFVGGLLLVVASTAAALDLSENAVVGLVVATAIVAAVVRLRLPPPSSVARRALVTPYILVTGRLFWTAIGAVTANGDVPAAIRQAGVADIASVLPIVGFLLAFSAVFYAMLVYAPRQVAEPDGGPFAWLVRYGLFAASVALGAGWLVLLGA